MPVERPDTIGFTQPVEGWLGSSLGPLPEDPDLKKESTLPVDDSCEFDLINAVKLGLTESIAGEATKLAGADYDVDPAKVDSFAESVARGFATMAADAPVFAAATMATGPAGAALYTTKAATTIARVLGPKFATPAGAAVKRLFRSKAVKQGAVAGVCAGTVAAPKETLRQ